MKNKIKENLIDSYKSVIPITIIILFLSFLLKVSNDLIISFFVSSILLILGITFFTTGADISIVEIGKSMGNFLVKKGKFILTLLVTLILGIVITLSEPDLMVLASELPSIPNDLMITLVSLGIGIFLMLGVYRIIKRKSYRKMMSISLFIIFVLLYFTNSNFVSVSFDAAGVTTGPLTVPVIVAFGYGIAKMRNDKDSNVDVFGLGGLASMGPVIVLLILGLFYKTDNFFDTTSFVSNLGVLDKILTSLLSSFKEIIVSLLPIVILFIISTIFGNKIKKEKVIKISLGLILTILGLTLFLTGAKSGFIEMGYLLGIKIISSDYKDFLIPLGLILGFIIITAEPAIKVLTKQISDLTEGSISRKMINLSLSIGVSLAVALSISRVIYNIPMIYIIIPGYFIAAMLMYFTPKMFINIAFDSGGAACGALTTSFLLPFCIGICTYLERNVLSLAFGVGSLVCLTPIITIELLGIIYDYKLKLLRSKRNNFDETIIDYEVTS